MGRCLTKRVFLIQSPILFLHLLISFSSGAVKPDLKGVCVSKGGRFPPYESEGKPPKSVGRGSKDLTLCRVFRKRTCCTSAQTNPAFVAVRNLATFGEANQECLNLFELLECSICNPNVGIQLGPPRICASFCDRVFEACKDAYFASNALTRVIGPCGVNDDIICVKASNSESNGTAFCEAAGFAVQTNVDSREEPCYGNKASLESVVESWSRDSRKKTPLKTETLSCFKDLLQWVREMTTIQKISLGVSSFVAGMFLISCYRQWNNRNQKQRLAAIQRTANRLGGNANGNSYSAAINRRTVQR
ncbi:Folate-binding protein 1 [Cardamine amara subsp. amara]|uniref:Folate-binding protein 1 n=1 Tax=Cardamine amara subsp. amara TaxID=228776 RepID=A0ABD1AGT1_CARAN